MHIGRADASELKRRPAALSQPPSRRPDTSHPSPAVGGSPPGRRAAGLPSPLFIRARFSAGVTAAPLFALAGQARKLGVG
jgi:hypothetical protein